MNGWLYRGGGLELWRELYAPFNLVPFPCGNSGVQMGGWFNRGDQLGRRSEGSQDAHPGLGGEVLRRAGGTPVSLPGSEVFTALTTGARSTPPSGSGPYNDVAFGLHKAAKYYYYPGWHEPGPTLEAIVNKDAWESLPDDLKAIVELAAQAVNNDMLAEFVHGNATALVQLMDDPNVEIRAFPADVLELLRSHTEAIVNEMAANDPAIARINESFRAYREKAAAWQAISERAFLETRGR
jgi:TRAP-type mannitol/chloroaromatic compound transport system substrate-binding protein